MSCSYISSHTGTLHTHTHTYTQEPFTHTHAHTHIHTGTLHTHTRTHTHTHRNPSHTHICIQYTHTHMHHTQKPTMGALDMGGASAEIAFIPSSPPDQNHTVEESVFGQTYKIYAHSYLCYGENEAYSRYLAQLVANNVRS